MDKTRTQSFESNKLTLSTLLMKGFPAAVYCFCGYLSGIAALPFGAYPFGMALLAAADRNAIFVLLGLSIASFSSFSGSLSIVFFGSYAALFLLRALICLTVAAPVGKRTLGEMMELLFCEARGYRVCTAALATFGLTLAILIGGGFLYYDLFGMLLSVAISPLSAYLLCAHFYQSGTKGRTLLRDVGFTLLCAIAAFGAAPLKIYGVSVAVAGGIFLVFAVCKRRGFWRGFFVAAAVGLAYSPILCPVFLLAALAFGAFSRFSAALVTSTTFFVAIGYAFYVRGIYALDGVVGGVLTACLAFSVYSKLVSEKEIKSEPKERGKTCCSVLEESELDSVRLWDMNRRMAAMSEGFANLSALFEDMKLRFPLKVELAEICKQAFCASCTGCAEYARCKSGLISGESQRFAELLARKGSVSVCDVSRELSEKCGRLPDILDEINYNFDIRFGRTERRESEDIESLLGKSYGYKALSALLSKSMEDESEEYIADLGASAALCDKLSELDSEITGVLVYGKRRKRVFVKGKDRDLLDSAILQIVALVRELIGIDLECDGVAVRRVGRGEEGCVELVESKRFSVSVVKRNEAVSADSLCGDCISMFENNDGLCFFCISDGMGSGRDAALTSELAVGFLQNMLSSGRMNRELLDMLNSFLRLRCESSAQECSATLDLLQLDTVSGEAIFFKSGAAPTYVCHGGNLFKLRSRTMPLGILAEPDVKEMHIDLDAGDMVVMMSDGVTGGREDCPYLFDLLRQNADSLGGSRTADLILKYARSNPEPDDVSLFVIKITG
jgi:serine phosphatase RsbU (regulator of sigma subunit)